MNRDLIDVLDTHFSYGMSTYQMENFVVNDFITPYRRMKQAVVEIKSRLHTLENERLNLREVKAKRKICELRPCANEHEEEIKDIARARLDMSIVDTECKIKQIEFELEAFNKALNASIEEQGGLEVVTKNLQSDSYHEQEERKYWIEKMAQSAMTDLLHTGTISKGILNSVTSMPVEDRALCFEKAINKQYHALEQLNKAKEQLLLEVD